MPTYERPETIVTTLIDAGTVLTLGTNLFSGPPRPALATNNVPGNCVFCYEMFSYRPDPYIGNAKDYREFRVTILVRQQAHSFATGQALARDIWQVLQRQDISAFAGFITILMDESSATYLGQDDLDYHRWQLNARLIYVG